MSNLKRRVSSLNPSERDKMLADLERAVRFLRRLQRRQQRHQRSFWN